MKGFHRMGVFWAGILAVGLALPAQAALYSRLGGQAYYDDVLNITWLADANLAATETFGVSGINANGEMTWDTAQSWIAAMNADGGTGYLGYNGWRLPTVAPINGTAFNYNPSYNGTTDVGYNVSAPTTAYAGSTASEMAYMYYNNLGDLGLYTPNSVYPGYTLQSGSGLANTGPFEHLQPYYYWSGVEWGPNPDLAWYFYFGDGYQEGSYKFSSFYAWAVLPGDVAVPEPASMALVGTALGGLLGLGRRRRRGLIR